MEERVDMLRLNAGKCHNLASTALTSAARKVLLGLAEKYDERACTNRELRQPFAT